MIIDRYNEFSDSQAFTATGDTASTSVVDLQAAGDSIGQELYLQIFVDTAVTTGTTSEVQFTLQTDSAEAFSSPTALWASAAIDSGTLVAGYQVVTVRIPAGCERYLRVLYTVTTAVLTAGAFSAFINNDLQANDFTA